MTRCMHASAVHSRPAAGSEGRKDERSNLELGYIQTTQLIGRGWGKKAGLLSDLDG
jgi:hypothetical protein